MAAAPFATAQDVADRWRTLTDDEAFLADVLIGDASRMIRLRWPDVDARITAATLDPDGVVAVVAYMVKRAMNNGGNEGWETRTETAGPFSIGGKLANPNGNLYLTAEDIRLFEPAGQRPRARMAWLA